MHFGKIKFFDIANGPGIRTSLFVSGCSNHCKGCFNPETWDPNYGQNFTEDYLNKILDSINSNIAGLSILGGDPLEPCNIDTVKAIIVAFRKRFNDTKTIWMWTGYKLENIVKNSKQWELANMVDVLVEGPFILEQKNLNLKYRGSSNQRVIDMKASKLLNSCVLIEE